jgi:hypothetical protein
MLLTRTGWLTKEMTLHRMRNCANEFESLDKQGNVEVFDSLLEKTTNARFGMVLKNYKDNNTGRQGKHRTDGTFRGALKAKTKKTEVNGQQAAMMPGLGEDSRD